MILSWFVKIMSWIAKIPSWLLRVALSAFFWRTREDENDQPQREEDYHDPLIWTRPHASHSCGDFSFAVCQANVDPVDFSQVEIGASAVFVGIYDSHGGPVAAKFVLGNLFSEFINFAVFQNTISDLALIGAIANVEDKFCERARMTGNYKSPYVCSGTCCLAGVVYKDLLLIANLGDSRAVLGYLNPANQIAAEQLTQDHNVNIAEVREQVQATHEDDPSLVCHRGGKYLIKGLLEVSRSIGDLYMKHSEFQVDAPEFRLSAPIRVQPAISSKPDILSRFLQPHHRFLIFASNELWKHLTNQEAVDIVHSYPPNGIAKRLIKAAQKAAASKANVPYEEVHKLGKGSSRREIHDDITVVVVFIDYESIKLKNHVTESSIRAFSDVFRPSKFDCIRHMM